MTEGLPAHRLEACLREARIVAGASNLKGRLYAHRKRSFDECGAGEGSAAGLGFRMSCTHEGASAAPGISR